RDLRLELTGLAAVPGTASAASAVPAARLAAAEEALRELRLSLPGTVGRVSWLPHGGGPAAAAQALIGTLDALAACAAPRPAQAALAALAERSAELAASLARIVAFDELEGARALEVTPRGFSLSLMPFDISHRFRALVEARRGAWIFTSATLSLGEEFGHFTGRLGLADAATLRIESPFDHERQS